MQLKGAERHYPVHKKELQAIVQALKKWHSDLLGSTFTVYTDHRTLEDFNTQKDSSQQQLHWQELMSQFEMEITEIKGDDNCMADALSYANAHHGVEDVFITGDLELMIRIQKERRTSSGEVFPVLGWAVPGY